jgi:hypothetical protein
MTPTDKQRIDALEGDLATLRADVALVARGLLDHQGAKPWLLRVIDRHQPGGDEAKPYTSPKQHEGVSA